MDDVKPVENIQRDSREKKSHLQMFFLENFKSHEKGSLSSTKTVRSSMRATESFRINGRYPLTVTARVTLVIVICFKGTLMQIC